MNKVILCWCKRVHLQRRAMENQGGEGSKDRDEAASQEKDNGEANLKNKSKSRSASENISSPNSPADGNEGTIDARKSKLMVEEGAEWFLKIKDLCQDQITSPLDLFSIHLHGFMLELGFKGEVGKDWKGPVGYVARYSLSNGPGIITAVSLTITTMGPIVKVHGVHPDLKTTFSTSRLAPKDFILEQEGLQTRNLALLAREFKNQIGVPLLNSARSHLGLVVTGLQGLPPELLLRILHLLPLTSVLRLSSVSRSLHSAAQDETLWRRLFLKSFGKSKTIFMERSCPEDGSSTSWKERFKEEELARRERQRREEEGRRRPFDLQPPPLFPFPDPSNPLQVQPPPQGFPGDHFYHQYGTVIHSSVICSQAMIFQGILGGDYDRYPGGLPGL